MQSVLFAVIVNTWEYHSLNITRLWLIDWLCICIREQNICVLHLWITENKNFNHIEKKKKPFFNKSIYNFIFLGDGHKQVRVGQVCTQIGTINMAVAYRTKMTISPTQTGRDTIMLKSDHFLKDLSPKHIRYNYNKKKWVKVFIFE